MPTTNLETLPHIVLERICEYLAQSDPKRRSIQAFSLASKRCCATAELQRFYQVRVTVRGRHSLRDILRQGNEILNADNRFRHVRRLTISGWGYALEEEKNYEVIDKIGDEDEDEEIQDYFGMRGCCGHSRIPNKYVTDGVPLPQYEARPEAWEPLAHFISKLPGLKDLVWDCGKGLPRHILSAVHTIGCRLHVKHFSLSSLIQDRQHPRDIDQNDSALATSPCLYSIIVPFYGFDDYGNVNYNQEAAMRMVAGAAPNLAHVWMRLSPPGDSIGQITDFSKLRHLVIHWNDDSRRVVTSLHVLKSLASHGHFKSLHALMLVIPVGSSPQLPEALLSLLGRLDPLKKLYLSGFITNKTFETALCHQGSTIRALRVMPRQHSGSRKSPSVLSAAQAKHLVEHCPNLEHLEFPVNRTQGDAEETAIFEN
ncbi:hypothetical protein GGR55DRAFT_703227 [Xylaria sp. FL0064]|nr:hypothetical protein GGR55DRAFT_703227 [Xylaria sp. FL0064]